MRQLSARGLLAISVRTKFTVVLLLVALLPMVLLTLQNNVNSRQALLASAREGLAGHTRLQAGSIDSYLADRLASVNVLASLPGIASYLAAAAGQQPAAAPDLIAAAQAIAHAKGSAAFFMDAKGTSVLTTDPATQGLNFGFRDYFKAAMAGNSYVESPVISIATKTYSLYFAAPVKDAGGKVVGAAILRTPAEDLQSLLAADANTLGQGSYGILLDAHGVRIANGADPSLNFSAVAPLPAAEVKHIVQEQKRFGSASGGLPMSPAPQLAHLAGMAGTAGSPVLAIDPGKGTTPTVEADAVRLKAKPWTYVEVLPVSTFMAAPNAELRDALLWLLMVAVVIILLAIVLAQRFTRPVEAIALYLRRVRDGDYQSRLTVASHDEFGRLAEDVNATVDRLTQLVQSSEQKDAMQSHIEKLLDEVSAVAEGDLRVEAEVTAGTLGSVADSFNYMIEELRRIIGAVQATTVEVSTSALQLRQSSERLAAGSAHQSAQIAETTLAVRSMDESIQRVAENASLSRQVAENGLTNAQRGGEAVAKTIASMNRIRVNVQETAKKVKQLGESSQEIGDIVKLIEDIADKTDLLALNAAIQAELAGEHGRGFAVLADEVRRLAERATASTKQIASLVKGIQSETQEAVTAMEESTREVVAGSQLADEAGQALLSIDHVMAQLAQRIAAISEATATQAEASAQITVTMRDISDVTTQANVSTIEAAEKVGYLDQVANRLRTSVSAFRLPEGQSA